MMDLFVANGHPDDRIEQHSTQVTYQEPFLLFHNNGKGLENVSSNAGPVFNLRLPRADWLWAISTIMARSMFLSQSTMGHRSY